MSDNCSTSVWRFRWMAFALLAAATVASAGMLLVACEDDAPPEARAYQTTHRTQLIGGPGALGEVGDYVIENDQIRLVVQDLDYNRGTGLFGGSLIDADLVRQDGEGDPFGGNGKDTFQEMFPIFLAEVIDPEEIVIADPADMDRDDISGDAAVLEIRGYGGEFVTMARFFNHAMINAYDAWEQFDHITDGGLPHSDGDPLVEFTARYILEPGDRHVRFETEMTNLDDGTLTFPSDIVTGLADFIVEDLFGEDVDIDFDEFVVPTGTALGVGAYNSVFVPGIGFDVQYGLEDSFAENPVDLPALPGQITDIIASSSDQGVSYGFAAAPDPEGNYLQQQSSFYEDNVDGELDDRSFLFLTELAGFALSFSHGIPEELAPGDSFTTANYFIIGPGDVASLRDELYDVHGVDTHTVTGRVRNDATGEPVGDGAEVLLYEAADRSCDADDDPYIFNQAKTRAEGYVEFELPATDGGSGYDYCYRTRYQGDTGDFVGFNLSDGDTTQLNMSAPGHGRVEAFIVDQSGNPIPAKMTIAGTYEPVEDLNPRHYLFDAVAGERWLTSETVDLVPGEETEYIEMIEFSGADGHASANVRPGEYTAYFSRGNEYGITEKEIEVTPGGITRLNVEVERQINPDGYLSGDYHMHAQGSVDSSLDYNRRVVSIAGEGVEVVVASDHNYISDYMPYIYRNELTPFLRSVIGLELTTMEAGHFNAFPLRQDIASQSRGSVEWQNHPPDEIFDRLREMGSVSEEDTIIQVNHPRDGLLGYFGQHNVDPLTGIADLPINTLDDPGPIEKATSSAIASSGPAFAEELDDGGYRSTFSYDFDAIELYNGKRVHLLHHFRMPFDRDEMPEEIRDQIDDETYESLPEQEGVILCDGDDVAYPGALDDWYNFLNYPDPDGIYRKHTGTANSDSHHYGTPDDPEPGSPRNYFYAGHNDPRKATPEQLSQALQDNHNISTNGPFVNMSVDGEPIGSTVSADDGTVDIDIVIKAADWVIGDDGFTYDIIANGEWIESGIPVAPEQFEDNVYTTTHEVDLDELDDFLWGDDEVRDTWFVIEVHGDTNLYPVVQPAEIPQIPFEEALGELGAAFGVGETPDGLAPAEVTDIQPFAFTNPIWVIDDRDGENRTEFTPPEPPIAECIDDEFQQGALVDPDEYIPFGTRRLDAKSVDMHFHSHDDLKIIQGERGQMRDVRTMFQHWHGH